jgi:hypothetical protein
MGLFGKLRGRQRPADTSADEAERAAEQKDWKALVESELDQTGTEEEDMSQNEQGGNVTGSPESSSLEQSQEAAADVSTTQGNWGGGKDAAADVAQGGSRTLLRVRSAPPQDSTFPWGEGSTTGKLEQEQGSARGIKVAKRSEQITTDKGSDFALSQESEGEREQRLSPFTDVEGIRVPWKSVLLDGLPKPYDPQGSYGEGDILVYTPDRPLFTGKSQTGKLHWGPCPKNMILHNGDLIEAPHTDHHGAAFWPGKEFVFQQWFLSVDLSNLTLCLKYPGAGSKFVWKNLSPELKIKHGVLEGAKHTDAQGQPLLPGLSFPIGEEVYQISLVDQSLVRKTKSGLEPLEEDIVIFMGRLIRDIPQEVIDGLFSDDNQASERGAVTSTELAVADQSELLPDLDEVSPRTDADIFSESQTGGSSGALPLIETVGHGVTEAELPTAANEECQSSEEQKTSVSQDEKESSMRNEEQAGWPDTLEFQAMTVLAGQGNASKPKKTLSQEKFLEDCFTLCCFEEQLSKSVLQAVTQRTFYPHHFYTLDGVDLDAVKKDWEGTPYQVWTGEQIASYLASNPPSTKTKAAHLFFSGHGQLDDLALIPLTLKQATLLCLVDRDYVFLSPEVHVKYPAQGSEPSAAIHWNRNQLIAYFQETPDIFDGCWRPREGGNSSPVYYNVQALLQAGWVRGSGGYQSSMQRTVFTAVWGDMGKVLKSFYDTDLVETLQQAQVLDGAAALFQEGTPEHSYYIVADRVVTHPHLKAFANLKGFELKKGYLPEGDSDHAITCRAFWKELLHTGCLVPKA